MSFELKMVAPLNLNGKLTSALSSVTDPAEWSAVLMYNEGQRVSLNAKKSIYQAVASSVGVNPDGDLTGKWIRVGATNFEKAFDQKISDKAKSEDGFLYYKFDDLPTCDTVVLLGLLGGEVSVLVRVYDEATSAYQVIYNKSESLVDAAAVVDALSYFGAPISVRTEMVFEGVPIFPSENSFPNELLVQIKSGYDNSPSFEGYEGLVEVGEIVVGSSMTLGKLQTGGSVGIDDYSKKERDIFGNYEVIERAYSDWVEFKISSNSYDSNFLKRTLASRRSMPTVYHAGRDGVEYGQTIFGFFAELGVELFSNPKSSITLRIEGLV